MKNRGRNIIIEAGLAAVAVLAICVSGLCFAGNTRAAAASPAQESERRQTAEMPTDQSTEKTSAAGNTAFTEQSAAISAAGNTALTEQSAASSFTGDPARMEQAAASVVMLTVYNDHDEKIGTGSGFAAFDPPVLVTAAHVIENMEYMIAECDSGETLRIETAIDADEDADVAICRLPDDAKLAVLPVAENEPLRGEKTAAIGSQFGIRNLVTIGNVCGRWDTEAVKWILFTAPVSGGCSGGPLLNDEGCVIGVITGTYEKGQNLNLAAPIEKAAALPK